MPHDIGQGKRGIWYTYFAIAPITAAAGALRVAGGEDLYRYEPPSGGTIADALEYLFVNGLVNRDQWPVEQARSDEPDWSSKHGALYTAMGAALIVKIGRRPHENHPSLSGGLAWMSRRCCLNRPNKSRQALLCTCDKPQQWLCRRRRSRHGPSCVMQKVIDYRLPSRRAMDDATVTLWSTHTAALGQNGEPSRSGRTIICSFIVPRVAKAAWSAISFGAHSVPAAIGAEHSDLSAVGMKAGHMVSLRRWQRKVVCQPRC